MASPSIRQERTGSAVTAATIEYDAAQERGEVRSVGRRNANIPIGNISSTVTDIGLTSKQVHEARAVRDANANGVQPQNVIVRQV
jgi:hypothetical protein